MMPDWVYTFLVTDLVPMLTATCAAVACAILGSFLVLRRQSMMGDAISHSVLPGLAGSFLLLSTRSSSAMLVGAAIAGVGTVLLIEIVKRFGRVEPGAAMGVVFSILFALGVLLIESGARDVDLDPDCVLHGQLEGLAWWGAPKNWNELGSWATYFPDSQAGNGLPRQLPTVFIVMLVVASFVLIAFKELRIASFDAGLATSMGYRAWLINAVLMVLVAITTVASFEAVGSILVIAMLICPAASARMLTDRLHTHVLLSAAIAVVTAVAGYSIAAWVPAILPARLGLSGGVNAAGMIAVLSGCVLFVTIVLSPTHGLVGQALAHRSVRDRVLLENMLGVLYRSQELVGTDQSATTPTSTIATTTPVATQPSSFSPRAIQIARARGLVTHTTHPGSHKFALTDQGIRQAADLVRRHRLWETYLVEELGLRPDHVHDAAEQLEHITDAPETDRTTDPHGKPIPRTDDGIPSTNRK